MPLLRELHRHHRHRSAARLPRRRRASPRTSRATACAIEPAPASVDVEIATVTGFGTEGGRKILESAQVGDLHVEWKRESRAVPAGARFVPTDQPLGAIAVYLCEPESDDGAIENGLVRGARRRGRVPDLARVRGRMTEMTGMLDATATLARIKIPAEAVIPLLLIMAAILLLVFASKGLGALHERSPQAAMILGLSLGGVASAVAIYLTVKIVPTRQANDLVHEGIQLVSLFDAVIAAFAGAVAGIMWRYAGQRWLGAGTATAIAGALIAKPFKWPLVHYWDGRGHEFSPTSETHLFFLLSGVALAVVAILPAAIPKRS